MDWLWQELVAEAIWTSIFISAAAAYEHREAILRKLGKRQPVLLSGTMEGGGTIKGTLTIDASTPSLARRLEELVSWYVHVS